MPKLRLLMVGLLSFAATATVLVPAPANAEIHTVRFFAAGCRADQGDDDAGELYLASSYWYNTHASSNFVIVCAPPFGTYLPMDEVSVVSLHVVDNNDDVSNGNFSAVACSMSRSSITAECGSASTTSGTGGSNLGISDLSAWEANVSDPFPYVRLTVPNSDTAGGFTNYSKFFGAYFGGDVP